MPIPLHLGEYVIGGMSMQSAGGFVMGYRMRS
jgi:hypothetical protein